MGRSNKHQDSNILDHESVLTSGSGDVGKDGATTRVKTATDVERATLARKETIAVRWLGAAVLVVLMTTAALVMSAVYSVARAAQHKEFHQAFEADADKVLQSFNRAVERRLEAIDALSVSITAYAMDSGSTFPNVTISAFKSRCANSRVLSDTPFIVYHPVVTEETRAGWEAYQAQHRNQFDEAHESEMAKIAYQNEQFEQVNNNRNLQQSYQSLSEQLATLSSSSLSPQTPPPSSLERPLNSITTPNANRTGYMAAPPNSGPYLPLWQWSPVLPMKSMLNLNILYNPAVRGAFLKTMETGQAVIDKVTSLEWNGGSEFWELVLSMSQYRRDIKRYLKDPMSIVGYPVFDSLDMSTRKVAGVISTNFYWQLYFHHVLSKNTRGIICVLENSHGQAHTYRIDHNVTYLGAGDQHDTKYNTMGLSSDIATYLSSIKSPETKSYTSVNLNSDYCNYKLTVYPSQANENLYVTQTPIRLTLLILAVFVFTSVVFILYTRAVGKRQDVVMTRAVASSAIVSSLFPSQVRDQIYQETTQADETKRKWQLFDTSSSKGDDDSTEGGCDGLGGAVSCSGGAGTSHASGRPIAAVYEDTTIMFADMVGFTMWSSMREPEQVFELLETLYKAFDSLAVRLHVFKVETVGDCYVAAAGVPDPQADHAAIMVQFASDCIVKMGQLTAELACTLGADTASLTLRVGLHSGPVTGGVLRGQKSRFQLFGDTMTIASRLESNGVAGCIHVSQQTAVELATQGKSTWVTRRTDVVTLKGKGGDAVQTYWAAPPRSVANFRQ